MQRMLTPHQTLRRVGPFALTEVRRDTDFRAVTGPEPVGVVGQKSRRPAMRPRSA
jgi:hypothetical protein